MKDIIYLCRPKLVSTDNDMPIVMEMKARLGARITYIFYDEKNLALIKRNYNLWEIINNMDSKIYILRHPNPIIKLLRTLSFIFRYSFRDIVILKTGDNLPMHKVTIWMLKRTSKVTEVKVFSRHRTNDGFRTMDTFQKLCAERGLGTGRWKFIDGTYDYILSCISSEQFKEYFDLDAPKDKVIQIGYVRELPEWQKHMNEAIKRNNVIKDPYFLYVLTYMGDRSYRKLIEPPRTEVIEESLNILKKYNKDIKTIFKPHAVTDVRMVEEILKKVNYSNYVIDYSHPMILSSKARFIFANNFSSVMYDAFYLGKIMVEYSQYDPELLKRLGNKSYGGDCCDFFIRRDQKRLEEVLNRLINGNVNIGRDPKFIKENFPDTQPEFYEFLDKMFVRKD